MYLLVISNSNLRKYLKFLLKYPIPLSNVDTGKLLKEGSFKNSFVNNRVHPVVVEC